MLINDPCNIFENMLPVINDTCKIFFKNNMLINDTGMCNIF
jgi:hypothetical protein